MDILKPLWRKMIRFGSLFSLLLVLLLGIPRFIIVLQANVTRNYNLVPMIFVFMMIAPLILLTREGRVAIGIKKPTNYWWLLYSFLMGVITCAVIFLFSELFFADAIGNSFVYISRSYQVPSVLNDSDRLIYFLIYSVIGMTFSPIGEELFYRGVVHGGFAADIGERNASLLDSLAFSLTHLAHFGIVYMYGSWMFLFLPALLWVIFLFAASQVFFFCKEKTGSIAGAILSHAGYNLCMMYFVFYHVL